MSSKTTEWILELVDRITAPLRAIQQGADDAATAVDGVDESLGETESHGDSLSELGVRIGAAAFAFNQASEAIGKFNAKFREAIAPGAEFQHSLAELSAITQTSGSALDGMGNKAKGLAEKFGGSSTGFLESFKDIVGSLGDSFTDAGALDLMGDNIGTLSKLMGGDAKAAAGALSTAMLQYGVDLSNPIEAAREATRMMNVMQAAANAGGSEVVDTAEALRQSGLLAKQSGLSFEELNASPEGLAKGKIVAGEAGTAMRNILLSMSTPENAPKQVAEGLKSYGVNIGLVADPTVKFTDRLRELQKIQGDAGLMESVFLKANIAAGQTLLNNIDTVDEWTDAVTGTNAAVEGAAVIMDTYIEKQSRPGAWIENLKIGFLNLVEPLAPFITLTGGAMTAVTDFGFAAYGLSVILKKDLWVGLLSGIRAIGSFVVSTVTGGGAFTAFSGVVSVCSRAIGVAIMNIPIIGWIAAAVSALTGPGIYFYNTSAAFRGFLWGLWEATKAVFGNIGKFIGDVLSGIWDLLKGVFNPANWFSDGYSFSDALDKIKNAASGFGESAGRAFAEGKEAGIAGFGKDGGETPAAVKTPVGQAKPRDGQTKVENGKVYAFKNDRWEEKVYDRKKKKKAAGGDGDGKSINLSGGGDGGGKSITQNVTVNMTNHGVNDPVRLAEQVVRQINDRLNDSLAAAG